MSNAKKKASPARPKLQTPTPKKRTPVKRRPESTEAIRSVAVPATTLPKLKKYRQISHGAIWALVLGFVGYLALALVTFSVDDPSFLRGIPSSTPVSNWAGLLGAYIADLGYFGLGLSVWWCVMAACVWLYKNFRLFNVESETHSGVLFGIGLGIILFSSPMVERLLFLGKLNTDVLLKDAGGWVGAITTDAFTTYLGKGGSLFILTILIAVGLKLLIQFSYHELILQLWDKAKQYANFVLEKNQSGEYVKAQEHTPTTSKNSNILTQLWQKLSGSLKNSKTQSSETENKKNKIKQDNTCKENKKRFSNKLNFFNDQKKKPKNKQQPEDNPIIETITSLEEEMPPFEDGVYRLPNVNQLRVNTEVLVQKMDADTLQPTADLIVEKLAEFGIKVEVNHAISGPVITRYEIKPDKGVKGNQIVNLAKDLARSMAMQSVRVVETIQGKNTMGLELPNEHRKNVLLHDILASNVFADSESKLSIALGTDIAGFPMVGDLAKMPHLLVGGMTGSGKSVGVNAMIMSILFKAKPDEVRMIMIDPKMLELSVYDGIPHLLCPVVTDMKAAGHALNWCVAEMEKRYRLMSHVGVRNLQSYNDKVIAAQNNGEPISNPFSLNPEQPEPLEKLPQIVIIIDELADLMMTERKAVETQITRIAQKARAAGMHMIIATQRPSVDVITGLIKANVPTRIAFTVQSKIDSRTILDQIGAEDLLKNGDLLFLLPGNAVPIRLQGAFVSDDEVHQVVSYIKAQEEPNYIDGLLTGEAILENKQFLPADLIRDSDFSDKDELYQQAMDFVLTTRKASISALQRSMRIGYNRAANLMQLLEEEGIVSAPEKNGVRHILVSKNQLD